MNKKKLLLSLILAASFSFSNIQAEETSIKDIDKSSSFAREAIIALAEKNIISGDQSGNYTPQKAVSRAEIVALLAKVLELDTTNLPEESTFKDVPKNHWANKYVEAAYRAGIITGKESNIFDPTATCSREQIAVMLVRAWDLVDSSEYPEIEIQNTMSDRDTISIWAYVEVDVALTSGLMNGVGKNTFAPKDNATKEQVAAVLYRYMNDETNIIEKVNQTYNINNQFKLIMNRDIIPSSFYKFDEENNLLVSKQFVERYIHQEIGEAFKNADYVLLKDLAQELGYKYTFHEAKNKAYLESSNAPMFPKLYNAVKKAASENYVGAVKTYAFMRVKDMNTGEFIFTETRSDSAVNKDVAYTRSYITVKVNNDRQEDEIEEIESVDKIYIRPRNGNWKEYDKKDLQTDIGQDLFSDIGIVGTILSQNFVDNYEHLPVQKSINTNMNGVIAESYNIVLDSNKIKYFMSPQQYNEIKDLLTYAYKGTEKFNIHYGVKDEQIVYSVVRFTGQISDNAGNKADVWVHIQTDYSEIGVESNITLPY